MTRKLFPIVVAVAISFATSAFASHCRNTGSFDKWLEAFKKDAIAQGISPRVITEASPSMTFDPAIIKRDHGQGVFSQTFLQFSDRMTGGNRIPNGQAMIRRHADLFARVEKQYGVPAPVLAAFWGLESDFGASFGKYKILSANATLAYDCRRSDFFRTQLLDTLRIIQRGDQRVDDLLGDWAGEFGGMQFTASDYLKNAVDFDGDGRRDLIKSIPDMLASAANLLVSLGWQRGQPWLQEVTVPRDMPWQEADNAIQHPVSQWTSGRQSGAWLAGIARSAGIFDPADGAARSGVSRLSELQGVPRLELGLCLFNHGRLLRDAHRRRAGGQSRGRQRHCRAVGAAGDRTCNGC